MLKLKTVLNLLLVLAVIFISYYSSMAGINGETQASISKKLSTDFTPAGYAFSIWGVIFVMLVIIAIKDIREAFSDEQGNQSCFNCWLTTALALTVFWTITWSYLLVGWSLLIMAAIFVSLLLAVIRKQSRPVSANITLALFFGWISVALLANESAWLVHIGLVNNDQGAWLSDPKFSIIQSTLGLVLFGLVLSSKAIKRGLEPAIFVYPLVGVWAYLAIMIKNSVGNPNMLVYVSAFCGLVLLVIAAYFGTKWNASYSAKTKD